MDQAGPVGISSSTTAAHLKGAVFKVRLGVVDTGFSLATFSVWGTGAKLWRIDSNQDYCLSNACNKVREEQGSCECMQDSDYNDGPRNLTWYGGR